MNKLQKITSIKIGGQAGQGIKSVGLMLAKLAARSGYHVYNSIEYPSLIKGGHNVIQINISPEELCAPRRASDLLVALNQDSVNKHHTEISIGGGILFDNGGRFDTSVVNSEVKLFGVPLSKIAADAGGVELYINMAALGAVIALFDGNLETLKSLIAEEFENKDTAVTDTNKKVAEAGYRFVKENFGTDIKSDLKPVGSLSNFVPHMVAAGADTLALGAIAAGVQFAAMYPMSPVSNVLTVLAENQEKFGFICKQPEDEISAINMAIGASFAGARALTATSGGGFCLMTEGYGLAGMTETPLVIFLGMRGGPATGLPTWSEQGDLRMVLHSHQGDFPRIVVAAADAKDAFELSLQAFNLADKYQTTVVLLIDRIIAENDTSFMMFDTNDYKINRGKVSLEKIDDYKRYKPEADGISLRTFPGTGNFFIANSDEHDEYGYSTEEIEERNKMMNKRMKKLETCELEDMQGPQIIGPADADITLVSWGSNKGSITQALKHFDNVNYVHITWMNPFPAKQLAAILAKAKHVVDIESNYTGQLAGLIREKTGIEITDKLLQFDGRQIYPEDIIEKINSTLKGLKK